MVIENGYSIGPRVGGLVMSAKKEPRREKTKKKKKIEARKTDGMSSFSGAVQKHPSHPSCFYFHKKQVRPGQTM